MNDKLRSTATVLGAWLCAVIGAGIAQAGVPDPYRVAADVDRQLAAETGSGASPDSAALADDETFLRRAFLDIIGKPPTPDDILAFCLDDQPAKRTQLVRRLLADAEFGENWGRYWRDVIMYRRTEDRALIAINSLTEFLVTQLNENKPWSDTATALITAAGDVRENGEAGLIVAQAGMPEDVTAEVSRIFLGIQIQCAQCHDHPTDRWKREQFHHMAAFFPRVGVRLDMETRSLIVTTTDFAMRRRPMGNNRFFGTPEHYMPDNDNPASEGTLMQPVFFVNEAKLPVGTRDADRRATLAKWITAVENPWFAKSLVNRLWAELVGEGFCEPIDDLGPDRECSAPATMDLLARGFTESGYDMKWLFATITATGAYQRESRSRRGTESEPFAANCSQRLRADQLYDSLITVLNLNGRLPPPPPGGGPLALRRDPRTLFGTIFGYDPSEPRADISASVPQALAMMNSPNFHQAISARRPDALGGILARNSDDSAALVELYLQTLSRAPTEKESQTCLAYIRQVGDRGEAFEDILWSLLNSAEFLYRR